MFGESDKEEGLKMTDTGFWHDKLTGSPLSQEITGHLEMAELTDLIWTTIDGLGSTSPSWVQASSNMLFLVVQEHGDNLATVRGWGLIQGQGGEGKS